MPMKDIFRKALGLVIGSGGVVLIVADSWQLDVPRAVTFACIGVGMALIGLLYSGD